MLEPSVFFLLCSLTGIAVGLTGGMLGIGGGVIVVPVLLTLYSQQTDIAGGITNLAVGTSLGSVFFTSLAAGYAHFKKKNIHWPIVRLWMPPVMLGSLSAGYGASLLPAQGLLGFVSFLFLLIAMSILFNWQSRPGRTMPGKPVAAGLGVLVGLLSGMTGVGGGNFIVPLMIYFNMLYVKAIALASVLAIPIALTGALGFMWAGWNLQPMPANTLGYVHWPATLAIALTSTLTAPVGVWLSHQAPVLLLRRIFSVFLLVTALRLLWLSFQAA